MKKITMALMLASTLITAKTYSKLTTEPSAFHGATANLKAYKALYILLPSQQLPNTFMNWKNNTRQNCLNGTATKFN